MCLHFEAVARKFAVLLSVLILAVPKCFLGDSPDENPIPTQLPGRDALLVGTDWYPEQWPESRWETDLRMMEAAHLQVVRLAEFAWSRLEPSEGQYDFAWLDRGIRLAEKHHLAVVLGTPTGGPPAWLTQKYPDTLRVEADGQRAGHGNRAHGSVTSRRYANTAGRSRRKWANTTVMTRMWSAGRSTMNMATDRCPTTKTPENNSRNG